MEQNWFIDLIRAFFAFLDRIVYGLIPVAYNLLIDISKYKLFSDTDISEIAGRIYTILGIFMLFKVSFSFISYIVNPDSMTDKEKGVQKIITNVVLMFVMLIMCPWIFKQLWGLQDAILKENLIGALVFGDGSAAVENEFKWDICDIDDPSSKAASTGDYIAIQVFRGFYQPMTIEDSGYDVSTTWDTDYGEVKEYMCKQRKNARLNDYLIADVYNADADVDGWTTPLFGKDLDIYIINYRILMSTAVGVVILLILVGFCMDVGLRLVKLSFLEIIAPIPIISYIDPNSGKNGIFKKWVNEVGTTWISIFIRLLALFFATTVIQKIGSLINIETGKTGEASIWVYIFVIIGALMFAKKLPSLIEKIFGIKLDGGFNVNPLKKIREQALGGKLVAGAATGVAAGSLALAGGAAANAWALGKNVKKDGLKKALLGTNNDGSTREFRNGQTGVRGFFAGANSIRRGFNNSVGSFVAGGASSAARAIARGKDGTWHPVKNATAGVKASSQARNLRDKDYGIKDKMQDYLTDVAGIKFSTGTTNMLKNEVNILEQELANLKRNEQAMTNALSERISGMGNFTGDLLRIFDGAAGTYDAKGNITSYKVKTYEEYAEHAARLEAQNQGENWDSLTDVQKNGYISMVENYGTIVDRTTFNSLNDLYNARNEADIKGRKTEREINDRKENMDKFKNRKS